MVETLDVQLRDRTIGALTRTRNGARFQYADELDRATRRMPLLSASLLTQAEPFSAERTSAWFTGLLPEDQQREEVARRFGLLPGTYFDMLREVGWECAGAVTIGVSGEVRTAELRPLTADDLAVRLAALPRHPYDDNEALRISLGGYQAKMLATRDQNGGWCLPAGGAVSTHILKPQPQERFPNLVASEAWAMTAARSATATADVELLRIAGAPLTLSVTRFDRFVDADGEVRRVHQEDAAQAMAVPPERKYASSGSPSKSDPTLERIADILWRYSVDPLAQLRKLLEQLIVNVALGNTDAHAKNYGLLHPSAGVLELTPMYDVVPALYVNPSMLEMGLRVDQLIRVDRVTRARLVAEAVSWKMPRKQAAAIIDDTLESLRFGADSATERYPDMGKLREHVISRIDVLSLSA